MTIYVSCETHNVRSKLLHVFNVISRSLVLNVYIWPYLRCCVMNMMLYVILFVFCIAEWLFECTVQKLVLVITCLETNEVLERWQFDIECDKSAKESRSARLLSSQKCLRGSVNIASTSQWKWLLLKQTAHKHEDNTALNDANIKFYVCPNSAHI